MKNYKNNILNVCLFESFLAKYFLEHPEIFTELLDKIYNAIESFIELNANNTEFDRCCFSIFSLMSKQDSSINDFNAVKQSRSLIVADTFLKYFIERTSACSKLNFLPLNNTVHAVVHTGLFKQAKFNTEVLLNKMRPEFLFSEKNRGVFELELVDESATRTIGLLAAEDVPAELTNYLTFDNYPSSQLYTPNEDSWMAKWMRAHHLPIISGASGGVGKTLSGLAKLVDLSPHEFTMLGLLIATSTIALGHHSFFEVMYPLSLLSDCIKEQTDLLAFYEQVLPDEVKQLNSYKLHRDSMHGAILIKDFCFDLSCGDEEPMKLIM